MNIEEAKLILSESSQEHVLAFWEKLSADEQVKLLVQIEDLDFKSIARMRNMLKAGDVAGASGGSEPVPPQVIELAGKERAAAYAVGEDQLRAGKVGILVVAGGQGSRLGYDGPKGAYSIGPVSGASLFYFHSRKILGLSQKYGVRIPFYIMTSDVNDSATRKHFEENGFFGLNPEDVLFFTQGMWPALDSDGRIMMDQPGHIFMSPDGHGGTLSALDKSGSLADMEKRGIETIFFFQVDNPLIEIADPAFIGAHAAQQADLSIKLCAKREPLEGLGVVVERDGRFEMVEYTELTDEQAHRRSDDGELYFKYGSVAIHLFSYDFLKAEALCDMPLHVARKKIPACDADGNVVTPSENNGCKFEKFIFDVLPDAKRVVNMAFERAEEFSPVKNAEGKDSPATCRQDLQLKWLRWLHELGVEMPLDESGLPVIPIEIDPAYALNAAELKEKGISLRGCGRPYSAH
ncbi:MAG: UDPGP type 1 family protein [Kiritimatiellae bacterium]|jgi:UDP-N-acetylglucosamine/UDP-N-acetylgalactosamine diphosphorylase|nr:UDPGP type 1 family protein [Kiritimatiellia bacterium]